MKISELLQTKEVTISCELFPPKKGSELKKAHEIVKEMAKVKPSFMSVTYGASGGISEHTVDLANEVQNVNGVLALAHLTCASSSRDKIQEVLKELEEHQIENILALRGDIPEHLEFPLPDQYHHASELIEEIRNFGDFCIGGACYPEGHPEAESIEMDIDNLKRKVDAGASHLVSQLFFDNNAFYGFYEKTRIAGIDVPVEAGIMPGTNRAQIERMVNICGAKLPKKFERVLQKYEDNKEALFDAGMAYAINQIVDLIANDVDGIHIFTMNNPRVAGRICDGIRHLV